MFNPLSAKFIKWSKTLKPFVGKVFDHFVGLALKCLNNISRFPSKSIKTKEVNGSCRKIALVQFSSNKVQNNKISKSI